jgi:hypothetical protein
MRAMQRAIQGTLESRVTEPPGLKHLSSVPLGGLLFPVFSEDTLFFQIFQQGIVHLGVGYIIRDKGRLSGLLRDIHQKLNFQLRQLNAFREQKLFWLSLCVQKVATPTLYHWQQRWKQQPTSGQ